MFTHGRSYSLLYNLYNLNDETDHYYRSHAIKLSSEHSKRYEEQAYITVYHIYNTRSAPFVKT